jgi:hypothetical protein
MVRLKFVFANHDGLVVEQEAEIKKSILEVKKDLIAAWPESQYSLYLFYFASPYA